MPDTPDQSEFSRRLQAAMQRAKAPAPAEPPAATATNTDAFQQRLATAMDPAAEAATEPPPPEPLPEAEPVGTGAYIVRKGDCTSSIAMDHGLYPETLWNDPGNTALREARVNMNVLLPGDRMHIPEKRLREEALAPEQRHRFRRRGVPEQLQIGFEDKDGAPYAGEAYTIDIDGLVREGFTDGSGFVREPIPPEARLAVIEFAERQETYEFTLGDLEPVDAVRGLQKRLKNLGFLAGRLSGAYDDATTAAVRDFQRHYALANTSGQVDAETRAQLVAVHRS